MALKVIDGRCRFEDGKLVVVIEGANPEEVTNTTAKKLAMQKAAACGYAYVGFNGHSGSYPVDSDGKTYENWNEQSKQGKIAAYRNDMRFMSGMPATM